MCDMSPATCRQSQCHLRDQSSIRVGALAGDVHHRTGRSGLVYASQIAPARAAAAAMGIQGVTAKDPRFIEPSLQDHWHCHKHADEQQFEWCGPDIPVCNLVC